MKRKSVCGENTLYILLWGMAVLCWFMAAPKVLAAQTEEEEDTVITISAAGDCTLGSDRSSPSSVNFYAVYNKKKPDYFFKKVNTIFEKDDMTLVNFEGTLTKSSARAQKKYAFKGKPSYVNILKKGSIEAVAFANNHCRDYGETSYRDSIACFKKADIVYSSYAKVGTYKVKGKKIGMISVNGLENTSYVKQLIHKGMKKLKKKKADICIVSMHAGIERNYSPSATQKSIARYAVKQGANLVLGHHPHVLQGIEKYKGAYIVYSLGNFCFGGNTNPPDKDTMIFQQSFVFHNGKLSKSRSAAKVIPCSLSSKKGINNYQPTVAKGKNKARIYKKLDGLCRPLGLTLKNKKGTYDGNLFAIHTRKKK